ncbi:MAG: (deoxy)nucleoside triphosphate pyrophosphohydrolase [Acidobacteriota bacterium]|nr:(deoxy)nucleoside triphosphate pyrophosphohydrolase [Acidobacteriota bacterium]
MVQVVAAILERDGQILIGQRTPRQSHPLKWEFPGGKVEPGETPEQATVRELEEELAIQVRGLTEITRYQFAYPGRNPIELVFFRITAWDREPSNVIFHNLEWAARADLPRYDFVEGDREFLQGLYTGSYGD